MKKFPIPQAIFDSLSQINGSGIQADKKLFSQDFISAWEFLKQYSGNQATFDSYRREIERLFQWAWLIEKKSILELNRQDIEKYLQFCLDPPKPWIGIKRTPRFLEQQGQRKPNQAWRPFVATVSKEEHKKGQKPNKNEYHLSQKAIQEIFTGLNSFYHYLALEEKVSINPIALIKQKNKYLQKRQSQAAVLRLTDQQWQACLKTAKEMAAAESRHERTLFMITALYLLYLRISELAASARWIPQMKHFYQDSNGHWWFKTVGKGNKIREIAVSDDMLAALKSYRKSMRLPALPSPNESTPLIPKEKGKGAITSTRQIRQLIQGCFNKAIEQLKQEGFESEANVFEAATVHWLRHTGISDDINKRHRPMAHVRDDAGHSSSAITDRYNDIELTERYQSAKNKKIRLKEKA